MEVGQGPNWSCSAKEEEKKTYCNIFLDIVCGNKSKSYNCTYSPFRYHAYNIFSLWVQEQVLQLYVSSLWVSRLQHFQCYNFQE
jgi:hypothetical protein